ncbi:hypothetical protein JZO73_13715 [Enterococcus plantarum]|uniref:LPD16 domain-containing protein n=1 Tax=Enterococcus plantarum TaxID=1077675 RepID=UPI001A8C667B|nr:LPD16 domain-containing protein [Enterococcus plantarum]MBO0468561.1 hypothetical protein [Enterococcus plantarum]
MEHTLKLKIKNNNNENSQTFEIVHPSEKEILDLLTDYNKNNRQSQGKVLTDYLKEQGVKTKPLARDNFQLMNFEYDAGNNILTTFYSVEVALSISNRYLFIQDCEDGFDYTFYDADFKSIDGGIYEADENVPMETAIKYLLEDNRLPWQLATQIDSSMLLEQVDRAEGICLEPIEQPPTKQSIIHSLTQEIQSITISKKELISKTHDLTDR